MATSLDDYTLPAVIGVMMLISVIQPPKKFYHMLMVDIITLMNISNGTTHKTVLLFVIHIGIWFVIVKNRMLD